jgi:hypothetical protein
MQIKVIVQEEYTVEFEQLALDTRGELCLTHEQYNRLSKKFNCSTILSGYIDNSTIFQPFPKTQRCIAKIKKIE